MSVLVFGTNCAVSVNWMYVSIMKCAVIDILTEVLMYRLLNTLIDTLTRLFIIGQLPNCLASSCSDKILQIV